MSLPKDYFLVSIREMKIALLIVASLLVPYSVDVLKDSGIDGTCAVRVRLRRCPTQKSKSFESASEGL